MRSCTQQQMCRLECHKVEGEFWETRTHKFFVCSSISCSSRLLIHNEYFRLQYVAVEYVHTARGRVFLGIRNIILNRTIIHDAHRNACFWQLTAISWQQQRSVHCTLLCVSLITNNLYFMPYGNMGTDHDIRTYDRNRETEPIRVSVRVRHRPMRRNPTKGLGWYLPALIRTMNRG